MASYSSADLGSPKGVVISVEGKEKCGKTWQVLHTAPHPLVYISCDRDNRRAVKAARMAGRQILWSGQYLYVPSPKLLHVAGQRADDDVLIENGKAAAKLWNPIHRDFMEALKDPKVTSVVLDSGTAAYNLVRLKSFGKVNGVGQFLYAKTNAIFRELLAAAQTSEKVVIIIHRLGPEFIKSVDEKGKEQSSQSGNFVMQGYRETNFEVDAIVRHWHGESGYRAKLMSEGVGRGDISGKVFKDAELDYRKIVAKLTRTKEEKWS